MKAPVGLSSDRTVLRSKMEGPRPDKFLRREYDYIVATYSLHHLTDAQKRDFLLDLRNYLKENGKIIIGDVAFETRKDLEQCKLKAEDTWDNDEIYFVVEELRKDFPALSFTQMSDCAGVLILD